VIENLFPVRHQLFFEDKIMCSGKIKIEIAIIRSMVISFKLNSNRYDD
jgi:hypothetical protein